MNHKILSTDEIKCLIRKGERLPFAIENYPSRGQTAVQELYQTEQGKFFLKRVSERNHIECQINVESGSLAEREFWAFQVAKTIGLIVPPLWLLDQFTTVQAWLDHPDGKTYKKSTGMMLLTSENIFDCAIFDWVTGQVDRHDANYLYDYREQRIIPVDSAHGFLRYEGALPDYLHLFEIGCAPQLDKRHRSAIQRKLNTMTENELEGLVPLRDVNEALALRARKEEVAGARCINDLLKLYRRR